MLSVSMSAAVGARIPPQSQEMLDLSDEIQASRQALAGLIAHIIRERRAHADVEDCLSECVRRAYEGRGRLRDGEPVRPWLFGIARHVALDLLRERKRRRDREAHEHKDAPPSQTGLARVPDPGPPADDQLALARRAQRVSRALLTLPDEQREALLLFHMEGLAYREISARLNVPVGTVGTWVLRARRGLTQALEDGEV